MANKLTVEEIESKRKYHKKRVDFYGRKLEEIKKEKNKIGFKY